MDTNVALKVARQVEAIAHGLLSIAADTREMEARVGPGILSCEDAERLAHLTDELVGITRS